MVPNTALAAYRKKHIEKKPLKVIIKQKLLTLALAKFFSPQIVNSLS